MAPALKLNEQEKMPFASGTDPNLTTAEEAAEQVLSASAEFSSLDFLREELLVRLTLAGLSLCKAVKFKVCDLCEPSAVLRPSARLVNLSREIDAVAVPLRLPKLGRIIGDYLTSQGFVEESVTIAEDHFEDLAFLSRQGTNAITPRTAERSLSRAWEACSRPLRLTFRDIKRIGKTLRGSSVRRKTAPDIVGLIKQHTSLFRATFRNCHDQENGMQEAALRLIQMTISESDRIQPSSVATVARHVHSELHSQKIVRNIPWGDLRWIEAPEHSETGSRLDPLYREDLLKELQYNMQWHLTRRQRRILELLYGLNGQPPTSVRRVSEQLRISPSVIYRDKYQALKRLRARLRRT